MERSDRVSGPKSESPHWVTANASAGLGLPFAPGERHRLVKRAVAALCWPFLRHQVEYNRALLAELVTIRDSLVDETRLLGEQTSEQLARFIPQCEVLVSQLDDVSTWLDELHSRVEELWVDRDLVHQEVELAQRQTLDRLEEALGVIRRELSELQEKTEQRRRKVDSSLGRAARP
jgi:polyhydroxyalkanoate synthesis regulator phasin